ncbi:GntR family transcriptional regulator [Streptomyces sp. NPDC005507]|uniref:GntR family transcriptional regulator n=1 Tax=unclassified Streptomyces TaxID=2593676 RepID=UPI0033BD8716
MDLDRSVPVWPQVRDDLRRRLAAQEWGPGARFPGTVTLAAEYGVTQSTVQKAVVALREEGLLFTVLGAGSYVAREERP